MIRMHDIWRTYDVGDSQVHALAGVDEHIRAGEHVAIMGPSGSGKSTLLNIIGCLDRPTRGSYELDGREIAGLSEAQLSRVRREVIGCVFQSYHLVPRLTAGQNVELPLVFAGVPRAERAQRVAEALDVVGLSERARHRPAQLSGGQRQRVAIARAMISGPRLLLADEPTGNLDRAAGEEILAHLDQLNAHGLTLIVVTHDPEVARRAKRIIVLEDGKIARRLPANELVSVVDALRNLERSV